MARVTLQSQIWRGKTPLNLENRDLGLTCHAFPATMPMAEGPNGWARFRPYYALLWKEKVTFVGAVVCGLIFAVASGFGLPYLMKEILPEIFHREDRTWESILLAVVWLPVVMAVRGIAGFGNAYLINFTGLRVLEAIRMRVFSHLQRLPLSTIDSYRSGELISRLYSDCQSVQIMIVNQSNDFLRQPLQLVAALGTLVYLGLEDRQMGVILLGLSFAPLLFIPIRIIGKRLLNKASQLQKQVGKTLSSLTDSLQAPKEIRLYGLEEQETTRFRRDTRRLFERNMKVVKYINGLSPINDLLGALAVAAAIAYQGHQGMIFHEMVPVLLAIYMTYEPIKKIGAVFAKFQKSRASIDRLEELLQLEDNMVDPMVPVPIPELKEIEFRKLSFRYDLPAEDEKSPILKDLNLKFYAGEIVALVGTSGAGKSTFIQLIPRLYDPYEGQILWNGIDIKSFSKKDLRGLMASVSQDPVLFNETIDYNIRLGRGGASFDELERAAIRAQAHGFIIQQPNGYSTIVGEKGSRLSGGQQQRLAIARAFLKDSPVMILDEATSALDSESESKIQESLKELIQGKTAFIVAHRFSTIKIATRILVFDKGEVVADGSHEYLYCNNDLYRSLCDHQLGGGRDS